MSNMPQHADEKAKWDRYYATLPLVEADESTEAFNRELVEHVAELVEPGGEILEAGCGGGWQSLALARLGGYRVTLMDFSAEALDYARRLFEREGRQAAFIEGDVFEPGEPAFDLVFNAGVLEHYAPDEQAQFLRGMASRSRRYVLVLAPNPRCYWYWLWRLHKSVHGEWVWGKEAPSADLGGAFRRAGLRLLGYSVLGASWTASFITGLPGIEPELARDLLRVHGSPVIPPDQRGYLVAALGAVGPAPGPPSRWKPTLNAEDGSAVELRAALADSLSACVAREKTIAALSRSLNGKQAELSEALGTLTAARQEELRQKEDWMKRAVESETRVSLLQADGARRESELAAARHKNRALRRENDALAAQLGRLEKRLTAMENSQRAERSELEARLREAEKRAQALAAEQEALTRRLAERQERIDELEIAAWAERQKARKELMAADHRRRRLARERDSKLAEIARLERRLAQLEAERRRAEATLRGELAAAKRLEKEALERARAADQRRQQAEQTGRELESRLAVRDAELEESARAANRLRIECLNGLAAYATRLAQELETYRRQRAWRLMLLARKLYTLLMRRGWKGWLELAGLPLRLLAGKGLGLEEFEPAFPEVWSYTPQALHVLPAAESDERQKIDQAKLPQRKFDVIVFPVFDFEFRFQRPQQIAVHLARRGHRVFWISPTRRVQPGPGRQYELAPLCENVWEVRLPGGAIDMYSGELDDAQAAAMLEGLRELYRDLTLAESCALLQFPFWRRLGLALRERFGARLVYDQMDDWENWPAEPRIGAFNLEEQRRLVQEADLLVVTARELYRRHAERGAEPLLIPNGADFRAFHDAGPAGALSHLKKPVVGYFGAISRWFDVELVAEMARRRPGYQFVLIGQVHDLDAGELEKLPNVHLLGEKPYRELPSYLCEFDACLIPFRLNSLTRAVDPVKMYEYFSQGKPVVASRMPELEPLAELLYLADGAEEFLAGLDKALGESDPALARRRIEFASRNSWADRVETLAGAVAARFPLVSVLVVTHNSREYIGPLVPSIRRNTSYPNYEVIFADNASTDGTAELLEEMLRGDARMRLIRLERNLGFAAGNNVAAAEARGEFLLLLNADTVVSWGWIERLMRPLRCDPSIGLVAPVTNYSGNETKINADYGNLTEMEEFAQELARAKTGQTTPISMAPLLCALIPRSVWEAAGGLDERYQVGMFEDDDFAMKLRQAGYRAVAAEDCFIHHFGGGSFLQLPPSEAARLFQENKARYERKWNTQWVEHRLRPGVRPVSAERRLSAKEFLRERAPSNGGGVSHRPVLKRLYPDRTRAGCPTNPQPGGFGALAVDCENAVPGTIVRFGSTPLQTSYGSPRRLTALAPPGLFAKPGVIAVSLVNHFGESNSLRFLIE